MKFYHGTPISGTNVQATKFLRNRHALVSFVNQNQLAEVSEVSSSFILDNGAFSAWKQGTEIDFEEYVKWASLWSKHPCFDWALIPDVIDGTEEENDYLLKQWPKNLNGVPVWHLHESLTRLFILCWNYKTVALGSSGEFKHPRTKLWWNRIAEVMGTICNENGVPMCKLHGLRMMDPRVFTLLPLSSADSTNVGVNVGSKKNFGIYLPPSASVRAEVIADRIEAYNSAKVWNPEAKYFKIATEFEE